MRIVIDLQGAQTASRFRGIGRYSISLAKAIVRNRGDHEVIIALNGWFQESVESIRTEFAGLLPKKNIRVWRLPGPVRENDRRNSVRREVAELIREAFLVSLKPDIVHVCSLFEGYSDDAITSIGHFDDSIAVSVTIHDLIPLLNPDLYLRPHPTFEEHYFRKLDSLRRASLLLAISESSRQEAIALLGGLEKSVINASEGCDACFSQMLISKDEAQAIHTKFGLTSSFVLYSGGADERKNLPRLVQAYALLPPALRESNRLVFAEKMSEHEIKSLQALRTEAGLLAHELVFTGYITDEELTYLYNLCTLFVFPSWHEGFGLPALEAMSCGAAVIGANVTSLPEVIGCSEALFDPFDIQGISSKIKQVLEDPDFRDRLKKHGLEQAKDFSWDKTAKRAISAFEEFRSTSSAKFSEISVQDLIQKLVDNIIKIVPYNVSESELVALANVLDCIKNLDEPKKLFVDISELVQRDARSGIQRVTRNIINMIIQNPPKGFAVVPVCASIDTIGYRQAQFNDAMFDSMASSKVNEPIEYSPGDVFLGLDLCPHVVPAQKEYLTSLRRDGVTVLFVVYDLIPVLMPQSFPAGADIAHKRWLETIISFDGAICISRSVAEELKQWLIKYPLSCDREFDVSWFHLGADLDNSSTKINKIIEKFKCRPTFLLVGTIEPRKGLAQVIDAFNWLWNQGLEANLVIVGKKGWGMDAFVERLSYHRKLNQCLFWLQGISDECLERIYSASTCLIAASESEGFGLPLIEAAQHKLPIIARDIPVFREVAGEHAYYFASSNASDLADLIQDWLRLYAEGKNPVSDTLPWLTWKQSAHQLLELLSISETFIDHPAKIRFPRDGSIEG